MNDNLVKTICTDPNARIPLEFRKNKQEASKFLVTSLSLMQQSEIKNHGWWAIKRWLDEEDATSDDFDEILSIEKLGEEKTFDLTVPDGNSFSANGFTVHNCNLPENVSKELVSQVYMEAWRSGCKGFTVYRDKSRDGVLVSVNETKKEDKGGNNLNAQKRPKELECDIHRLNVRNGEETESWMVIVGLLDNKPYEIFAGLASNIEVPKKIKKGKIVKNGKKDGISTYNLVVPFEDEQLIFKDVVNLFDNPVYGSFTRTISLAMRHEIPINFIVEQVQKDKDSNMFSFNKSLARVLKTYVPDGTKTSKKCSDCGSHDLTYQEGCLTCLSCGSSKCG